MPLDSGSEKVTKLSNARSIRGEEVSKEKPVTEQKMVEMFGQFVVPLTDQMKELSSKVTRLENSIALMGQQFQAIKSGEAEDAALRVTADAEADVDIASVRAVINSQDWYIYTTGELAEKLGIGINQTTQLIKNCSLKGNEKYHTEISTGKSENSFVNKYTEDAFNRLKQEIKSI